MTIQQQLARIAHEEGTTVSALRRQILKDTAHKFNGHVPLDKRQEVFAEWVELYWMTRQFEAEMCGASA